ncbi:MAG: hypothetical protein P4L31_02930 [Candidatus Babeliales bacterium]|nr:hypothetical protein [Candidatus Babeliales bacterium]
MKKISFGALLLYFLACFQLSMSACFQKKSSSRLVKHVDGLSNEIDAHDSMVGMHMDPEKPAPVVQSEAPNPVVAQAPVVQAVVSEKKVESEMSKGTVKFEQAAPDISAIDRAKQQIKDAELELAKLKQLVAAAQAAPAVEDVIQVIELNKKLIAVFDKQIREYRAHGASYSDPRIKQLRQNIGNAEQELDLYEKQLKSIKPVITATPTVEIVKKKTELKSDVQSPHAHNAAPVQVKSVAAASLMKHEHALAVLPTKPMQHAEHNNAASMVSAHSTVPAAPMSHDHAAAMPAQAGAAPMDHMNMPPLPAGSSVEESAAYKNLHAYHSQGLMPSQFKLTPFGYIQNEISYATRQLSVIQEFQPFLVPINAAIDANGVDVENRSQFIPALHAHIGTLITGPEVMDAKASGDVSLEFYAPFPLNYAPATDPGLAVRIAGIILIHASMFVEWKKTVLLLGQTWHPGEDPEVSIAGDRVTFFGTLSDPMNRLYQIRLTQKVLPQFNFIAALTSNLDFKAAQNLGIDKDQIQNPFWLNFHFQARAKINQNVFALAADIYTEQPRLFETTQLVLDDDAALVLDTQVFPPSLSTCAPQTKAFSAGNFNNSAAIFATKQSVTSFSMMAFAKVDRDPFVFKAKVLAGSSLGHPLGGFAIMNNCTSPTPVLNTNNECVVTGVNTCLDTTLSDCMGTGACTVITPQPCIVPSAIASSYQAIRGYGPMRIATFASEIYLKNKIEPGIYIGVTKNLGSKDQIWDFQDLSPLHQKCSATNPESLLLCLADNGEINASIFKYVSDLDYTILIAPRIKWTIAPVMFSAEIEYTKASYVNSGAVLTKFGTVTCSKPVDVIRFVLEGSFNF